MKTAYPILRSSPRLEFKIVFELLPSFLGILDGGLTPPWIRPRGLNTDHMTIMRPRSTTFIEMSKSYLLSFTHFWLFFLSWGGGPTPLKIEAGKKYIVEETPKILTNICVKFHENPTVFLFFFILGRGPPWISLGYAPEVSKLIIRLL